MTTKQSIETSSLIEQATEFCRKGEIDKARSLCENKIIELRFLLADALTALAYVSNREENRDEELSNLVEAISIDPSYRGAHYGLMILYSETERYREAASSAEELLSLEEDASTKAFSNSAHLHGAFAQFKLGNGAKARKHIAACTYEGRFMVAGSMIEVSDLRSAIDSL